MKTFRILLPLLLLAAAAGVLIKRKAAVEALPTPAPHSVAVTVTTPAVREVVQSFDLLAQVRSTQLAQIATRTSSRITALPVREAQSVRKGDLLVRLDDGDVRREIRALDARKSALADEIAVLKKRADSDNTLYRAGALSEERYDTSHLLLQTRQAALQELELTIETRRQQLPYYDIRAPFDGTIGSVAAEIGDIAVPGKPLMQLHALTTELRFVYPPSLTIPENAPVFSGEAKIGAVSAFYANAPQGLFEAEAHLDKPNAFVHGEMLPVSVRLRQVSGCSVPEQALLSSRGATEVMTYRDGAFVPLSVEVLARGDSYAAVEPCPQHPVAVASAQRLAMLPLLGGVTVTERP